MVRFSSRPILEFKDWNSWRKTGRYYTAPNRGGTLISGQLSASLAPIYAMPFISPTRRVWDRMAVNVTVAEVGGTQEARIGIYKDSGMYPSDLLVDCGLVDFSGIGIKQATINQTLEKNSLYWLVFLCGDNDFGGAVSAINSANFIPLLGGATATGTQAIGWYTDEIANDGGSGAGTPLPNPFPSDGTQIFINSLPLMSLRLKT